MSDLGLARRLDDDMDLTATGSGIGSPHFMSPEQATDAHRADHRSDIYSLGITLFFLVTGTRPFDGATAYAIVLAHANNPLPRAADLGVELPENLQRLIERMTAKRPLERYQDYRSLIADVRRVKAGHSIASAPAPDDVTLASGQGLSAGLGASELPSVPHAGPAPSAPAAASKPAQSDTRDAEPRGLRQPVLLAVTIVFAALAIVVAIVATNRPNRDGGTSKPGQPFNVEPGKGTDVSQTEPKGPPDPDGGFRPPPKGAKGLPPSPLPPLPEIRSPLADGPVAEMFAQAQAFAASNPSAFRQMLARFEQVQAKAAGSALAAQVDAAIATKKRMRDAAVESSMVEFSKRMTAEESRMGPHCVHVWSEFPEELRSEELDRRIYDLVLNTIGRVTGNDPRKGGPPPEFGPKGKESEEFPKKGKEFEDSSKKGKKGGEGGPKGKRPPDDG